MIWHSGEESACQCRRLKRHQFDPWLGKIPWRRKWQPTPVFLSGKFHGERNLAGFMGSQRDRQNWATEHAHTKTNKWANNIQHFPQFDLFSKEKHPSYILVTRTLMLNWISFSVQHGRTPIMASSPLWVILQVLYWEPLWQYSSHFKESF